ncbi:MAG TPA: hypothetical protein EYQ26_02905 [Rhodospirillales bacterium]|nr:hypothetical protein [Rhodospirillales bacterium]
MRDSVMLAASAAGSCIDTSFLTNHDGHIPWQIPARKKLGRRLFGPNPAMYPVRERPWNRSTSASLSKHAQKTVAIHATRVFARREWW